MEQISDLEEKPEKQPGRLMIAVAGGLLAGMWTAFLEPFVRYQFWQSDTFWLIEIGRRIIQTQHLPTTDPYSFASSSSQWIIYQWLPEVIFSVAHSIGGLTAVAVFGEVLLAILFCVLIYRRLLKDGTNPIVGLWTTWLAAYAFYPDLSSLRPQLFSFLLFWLLVEVCADSKLGQPLWKAIAKTFVIAVIWANCHISFLVGLLVLGANFVGSFLLYKFRKADKRLSNTFGILFITFVVATLVTPYRFALWGYLSSVHDLYYTQEVQPLLWANQPLLVLTAAASFFACLYLRKSFDLPNFLAAFALISVGSNCGRLIVYFCIFACPQISDALTKLLQPVFRLGLLRRLSAAMRLIALSQIYVYAIVVIAAYLVIGQPVFLRRNVPVQAAQYLAEHPVQGNLFCSAHIGSYLIYSTHGAIKVFMDTRMDLYNAAFVERFADALKEGKGWKELFEQYKITAALVPNAMKLQLILDGEPDWKQTYHDTDFSLYIRK